MNIETFKIKYASFKDVDWIEIDCDHPKHSEHSQTKIISIRKQGAKRNILKNNSEQFICRDCCMFFKNPMNQTEPNRQTKEIITVICPDPQHEGDIARTMSKSSYYGSNKEPYIQICGSCSQRGKEITQEQCEKIRLALSGITRSEEFKQKIREYMLNNPEGIKRSKNLIPGFSAGWNKKTNQIKDENQ